MQTRTLTLLEGIFAMKLGRPVFPGDEVMMPVDLVMAHDATAALLIEDFERLGCSVWNPDKFVITCDHFSPPPRIDWADLQKQVVQFAKRNGISDVRMNTGICHQLMLEDRRVLPGQILVGADSHTVTAGAVGCFATGLGATDILGCLATGQTWFRVPESVQVNIQGQLRPWVTGRDLALHLLLHFGEEGASYRVLELWDRTAHGLSMDNRAAITCMATEMGAKAALFVPDATTEAYLRARNGYEPPMIPAPLEGAEYAETLIVDVDIVPSLVACPHSPANVAPATTVADVALDEVYIGSCASGRLEDLAIAARILRGKKVAAGLKVVAVPSSVPIMQQAIAQGYIQTLLDAGVCVSNPSCGACGGIDKGVLANGDVALTTTTRNFQGRLGPRDSAVYLASTATCAASALTGRITPPEEVWEA